MRVTPNHVPRAKRKECQLCNHYNNSVITRPIALKLRMHLGTHPAMYLHVSQLECDCTCARARQRSFQDRPENATKAHVIAQGSIPTRFDCLTNDYVPAFVANSFIKKISSPCLVGQTIKTSTVPSAWVLSSNSTITMHLRVIWPKYPSLLQSVVLWKMSQSGAR